MPHSICAESSLSIEGEEWSSWSLLHGPSEGCLPPVHTRSFFNQGQRGGSELTLGKTRILCFYRSKSRHQECVSGKLGVGRRDLGWILLSCGRYIMWLYIMWPRLSSRPLPSDPTVLPDPSSYPGWALGWGRSVLLSKERTALDPCEAPACQAFGAKVLASCP